MEKKYTFIAAILVVLLTASAIIDLNFRTVRYFADEALKSVNADAVVNTRTINNVIEEKFTLLEYMAGQSNIRTALAQSFNFGTNIPGFSRIYTYDSEGNAYCDTKFLGNFSDHDFFRTVMSGERNLYVTDYTGNGEFVFSVPVKDEKGNPFGVISGICSSRAIYEAFMIEPGENKRVFIYDYLGRRIMTDPTVKESSIKRISYEVDASERMVRDMREKKEGIISFSLDDIGYKLSYNLIPENDWYVLSVAAYNSTLRTMMLNSRLQLILKLVLIFIILGVYVYLMYRGYRENVEQVKDETSMLTKLIPGSTLMCKLDELLTIKYASESMYTKLGYISGSADAMTTLGLREIIHPDDLRGFNKLFSEFKNTNSKFEYECRFICKNGRPKWMNCYGRFVNNVNGIKNLYIVAIDISDQKLAEEKLRMSEERYNVVIRQSNSIVFEYNIKTHDYFVTNNFYEVFSVNANAGDIFAVFMKQRRMHSDDKMKFEQMIGEMYTRCGYREEEMRIMDASKKFVWYSVKITSISDNGSTPSRIIGNITNIDAQKRNAIELANRSQSDSLTGCLNRDEVMSVTHRMIENETDELINALIIIDIDQFSAVNERCGRETGDDLLRKVASMIKGQVRSSDVIGRIGDDEFLVYIRGCSSIEHITNKLSSFVHLAHNIVSGDYRGASVSVGAAIYPNHSRSFEDLYDKADKSLYLAKTSGGDKYVVYDEHRKKV